MLIDHLTGHIGCGPEDHNHQYDEMDLSISEFLEKRDEILDSLPIMAEPDFAQEHRLPKPARIYLGQAELKDEWEKYLKAPLDHITDEEWDQCWHQFEHLLSGGSEPKNLRVGKKDDISISEDSREKDMARGEASIDIDSILAMFTDLSAINTVIRISVLSNPTKNLGASIHLSHRGMPMHHIPHFYLGSFGHDPKYDLFIVLPELYNSNIKRDKRNLHNHVPEDIRAEFMNTCLLPAVREVVDPNESQSWDFDYVVSKAKSTASAKEGKLNRSSKAKSFHQEVLFDLDARHIERTWEICERSLRDNIKRNGKLNAFRGFQFFIDAKGYKHRMKTKEFPELMKIYKDKVVPFKSH